MSKESSAGSPRGARLLLNMLDVALALAVILWILAWFFDPLCFSLVAGHTMTCHWDGPFLAALVLWLVRMGWRTAMRRKDPAFGGWGESALYRKCALAILPTFLMLVVLEALLGWMGVKTVEWERPIVVTGKNTDEAVADSHGVLHDPEVLFAFKPGAMWDRIRINRYGFRTHEFDIPKPEGWMRVVSLGDSCTAQGHPPYSELLNERLQQNPPGGRTWEAVNMGVFGYSILQGTKVYQRWSDQLGADVVTVYFGWNDHWTEHNVTDHQRMASRMGPVAASMLKAFRKKRLYAVLNNVISKRWKDDIGRSTTDRRVPRVPPEEYKATLRQLIEQIRASGAVPLILTAPRRHLTETLIASGHARSVEEAEALHDEYVEMTRAVAAEENADILDLAGMLADKTYDEGYFSQDGIHWTDDRGLPLLAELLDQKIRSMASEGKIPGL